MQEGLKELFKVRRGSGEEIPLVQGKEQWLRFAGEKHVLYIYIWASPVAQQYRIHLHAGGTGDVSLIPGSGRSPGEGIGYPLQYSWASLMAQLAWKPSSQHAGEKRGVAGLLLGRTEPGSEIELLSRALAGGFFTTEPPGKPCVIF